MHRARLKVSRRFAYSSTSCTCVLARLGARHTRGIATCQMWTFFLSVLLAAVAHDVGHVGYFALLYLAKSEIVLVVLFRDRSVENGNFLDAASEDITVE